MKDFGINVRKLKTDTHLEVITEDDNSYYIKLTNRKGKVVLLDKEGYFPEEMEVIINGSTKQGNVLKIGWIGKDMQIEFILLNKEKFTTENVKSIIIRGKDWEYILD